MSALERSAIENILILCSQSLASLGYRQTSFVICDTGLLLCTETLKTSLIDTPCNTGGI